MNSSVVRYTGILRTDSQGERCTEYVLASEYDRLAAEHKAFRISSDIKQANLELAIGERPEQAEGALGELDDQAFDRNAESLTAEALGTGGGINPQATSIDDLFLDETPAPELERPEVVGVRYEDGTILSAEDCGTALNVCAKVQTPLMTITQHARVVAGWADLFNRATDRADAAQARVAELEKQEPVALANRGLHAFWVKWTDAAAGLYGPGIKLYAHPVAQAGQVPEGYRLIRIEYFDSIKAQLNPQQVDAYRGRNIYDEDKVYANWEACRSALDEIKDVFQQVDWDAENELAELIAASPAQGGE